MRKLIPWVLGIASGVYYYLLSAKIFTWVYLSVDAGEWLSLLHWWYVPHRFGKPLIILLSRGVGVFPGDDVLKLTVAMAIIPAAITVAFTYLIALRLTGKVYLAVIAALVLMGAAVFTSQAGVVEQYTFTAMFVTLAYWFHIKGSKVGTLACLGLVTATHIVGVFFLLVWVFVYWPERKEWFKASWAYFVTGILPYGLLFALMANPDVPRLHAGGLNFQAVFEYFFAGDAAAAMLAVHAAPQRILEMVQVTLITLGGAVVPFIVAMRVQDRNAKLLLGMMGFTMWFWLTALYPSVWKYAAFFLPLVAVYAAIGLTKLPKWHTVVILVWAIALIGLNAVYFNTDVIAREDPRATDFYEAVWALPDGVAVVTARGGAYGFALHYALAEGKDFIPLPQHNPYESGEEIPREPDQRYRDSLEWAKRTYGLEGENMFDLIEYARNQGLEVYYGQPLTPTWERMIEVEGTVPGRIISIYRDHKEARN